MTPRDPKTRAVIVSAVRLDTYAPEAMSKAARSRKSRRHIIIDSKRCIPCFCCQEICPEGAITVSAGLVARLLGLGVR